MKLQKPPSFTSPPHRRTVRTHHLVAIADFAAVGDERHIVSDHANSEVGQRKLGAEVSSGSRDDLVAVEDLARLADSMKPCATASMWAASNRVRGRQSDSSRSISSCLISPILSKIVCRDLIDYAGYQRRKSRSVRLVTLSSRPRNISA